MAPHANGSVEPSRQNSPKPPKRLYTVKETAFEGLKPAPPNGYRNTTPDTAIVIDNGSGTTKAGWSTDTNPRLTLPPIMSRYTDRKLSRKCTFVGSDAYVDANSRQQLKNAFGAGSGLVANWDVMENVLSFIFRRLGVDGSDGGVGRPIVMTEALANLGSARKAMTEIIFERYSAPSIAYGVDSLFSYRHNNGKSGLVLSSSHTSTELIPIFNSKPILSHATRLNWGGYQGTEYLLKLLQVKYPTFPGKLTSVQAAEMVRDHCYLSQDYPLETSHFLDWAGLEDRDHVIQYPFTEQIVLEKTPEELARIAERKKESGRRLQEQAAKQRLEKLIKKEEELEYYQDLQEKAQSITKKEFRRILDNNELRDEVHLERTIKELSAKIRKARMKDVGAVENEGEEEKEIPTYPLLDIPDEELDENGLKQKRHQRLLKAGFDSRQRAKAEKEAEASRKAMEAEKDAKRREDDLEGWIEDRRANYAALRQRMKDRERLKADLSNRKSMASQMRMKSIANLASDNPADSGTGGKKRRRGGGEDTFGANDDDWGVYRSIAAEADSDGEDEEDSAAVLANLEQELLQYDASFTEKDTLAAQSDWTKSIVHAFLRGTSPYDPENIRENHQLHLNVERIRVPEVVFQPSLAGVDQAGIVEIAADILLHRLQAPEQKENILKDVFCTGGNVLFRGFEERLRSELLAVLPANAPLGVRLAKDPLLDAWRGAAGWARKTEDWKAARVTREEYSEKGADYIKEHDLGNAFAG